ncbi:MAG: cell division protein SepF [Acidimicrobiales bacterium]
MASVWRKTLIYLGLVDDDEYDDFDGFDEPAPINGGNRRSARSEQPDVPPTIEPALGVVRTLPTSDSSVTISERPSAVIRPITPVARPKVHVVAPGGFNDAQEIGTRLKGRQPVIVNLQGVDRDLSRRIIDFSSGLAFGLDGQMEKVADQVFLLTPTNMEVSAEEKRRLQERGLYRSDRS